MPSKSTKRNRIKVVDGSTLSDPSIPLGSTLPKATLKSTPEELELEEAVFGFVPPEKAKKQKKKSIVQAKPAEVDEVQASRNLLADLADDQLFVVDGPCQSTETGKAVAPEHSSPPSLPPRPVASLKKKPSRKPVWKDTSAEQVSVSLTQGPSRRKKLRTLDDLGQALDPKQELSINGEEYENRLRVQFEKMHPTPAWLQERRQAKRKARDEGVRSDDDDDEGIDLQQILKSTGDLSSGKRSAHARRGTHLPKGELELARLRDANQAEPSTTKGSISCLQFHPHSSVLLTGSAKSKRLSFFKIDGTHNPALHFVHTPDLPIEAAEFCPAPNGVSSSVIMTGRRPFFYTFDMHTCQCIKSPHGLFHKSLTAQSTKGTSLSRFKFSPQGNLLAFLGLNGLIELVDWSNNISSSQVIGSLKSNMPIKSLAWSRNGTELLTLGNNAEVSVWDLRMRRLVGSWLDDGGFNPTQIATTDQDSQRAPDGAVYTAIGSQTGIVNVYPGAGAEAESKFQVARKPLKTIDNLTTAISSLKFNPDGQVLAIASEAKKSAFKLVHLPSGTVFSNWPTSGTPLGHVTDVSFSHTSEMVAIGNTRGRVLLYSLGWWEKQRKATA